MKKKILFTILLIIYFLGSFAVIYSILYGQAYNKPEKMYNNSINHDEIEYNDISLEENTVINDTNEEVYDEVDVRESTEGSVNNAEKETFSASNNSSSQSEKTSNKPSSNSKSSNNSSKKEPVKKIDDKKTTEIKEEPKKEDEKQEEKKEEVQPKVKEETSKTIEIVVEEPKESDYKNDPEYIKMKKELFSSRDECLKKGIDLSFSDSENIASTMCTSESYKGKEVGFRLYIRYKDGTYKEYKK